MPPEIAAAYEILARAKQNPLPNPNAGPAQLRWPQFAPPPVNPMLSSYYQPHYLGQSPAHHMPASAPAPMSYPHGYPTDTPSGLKAKPGKTAPRPASVYSHAGKAVRPSLASQNNTDEADDENFSASSEGAGQPTSNKRPRKIRQYMDPVYATLSKDTMIGVMEKYGPIVWKSGARRPYLDWDKERTLFALRQIFFRWNPNFTDDFYYFQPTDSWVPIRGEKNEVARRVEIRRRCHEETKGLRTKMYEKRRNGPRSDWKTHTSRYTRVRDRCYRSNAEKEKKADDLHELRSDDDPERRRREDKEGFEKVWTTTYEP